MKARLYVVISLLVALSLACRQAGIAMPQIQSESTRTEVTRTTSDSQGRASLVDPLSGEAFEFNVRDAQSGASLAHIELAISSDGSSSLLLAADPEGKYLPQVFDLNELGASASKSVSRPAQIGPITLFLTAIAVLQTGRALYDLIQNPPRLDALGDNYNDYCWTGDQLSSGFDFGTGAAGLFAPLPKTDKAADIFLDLLKGRAADQVSAGISGANGIMRIRVYSVAGFPVPIVAEIDYCLEPLNRVDPDSIVAWVNYSIEEHDPYPILQLFEGDRMGYTVFQEAGQGVTRAQFEADLTRRLQSNAKCIGYSMDEYELAVWASDWSPAWQQTESCYIDGCNVVSPPWESSTVGFMFHEFDGAWQLSFLKLDTPEDYYLGLNQTLTSCGQSYNAPLPTLETFGSSASSCPGAPQQRLEIGSRAYVCTSGDNVIMRTDADRGADAMHRYPPGTVLDVVAGPACADGWSWWQVRDEDGLVGWMSEGGSSTNPYFLCPTP